MDSSSFQGGFEIKGPQGPGFIDNLRFIDNYREFNFNDKIYFIISESKIFLLPNTRQSTPF